MVTINVKTETDTARGWVFCVDLEDGDETHSFDVSLSWPDYDHWSHGRVAPERVVMAAFEFLLKREPISSIMPKFDCAVIRRYFNDVDAELPKML